MYRRLGCWLLAACVLSGLGGCASRGAFSGRFGSPRISSVAATSPRDYQARGPVVEVPMDLSQNRAVVDARIEGHGPFHFQIDTGAEICVIDPRLVKQLGLKTRLIRTELKTPSGETRGDFAFARISSISIGGATFREVDALVFEMTPPYRGLINFGLFKDCILTMDYPTRTLRIEKALRRSPRMREAMPYDLIHGVPVIDISLGSRRFPVIIDSGFNQFLSVPEEMERYLRFDARPVSFAEIQTLDSEFDARIGRVLDPVQLGPWVVPRPIVMLGGGTPLLGVGLMETFAVTFDPRYREVRFLRRSRGPVLLDSVWGYGFRVHRDGDQGPYTVTHVVPGSQAEAAGLRQADRIVGWYRDDERESNGRRSPYVLAIRRRGVPRELEVMVPWERLVR